MPPESVAMFTMQAAAQPGLALRILPEGLFVLWQWCGCPRQPIGDLEQAWRAYV
jgi:hypothetical protein